MIGKRYKFNRVLLISLFSLFLLGGAFLAAPDIATA